MTMNKNADRISDHRMQIDGDEFITVGKRALHCAYDWDEVPIPI